MEGPWPIRWLYRFVLLLKMGSNGPYKTLESESNWISILHYSDALQNSVAGMRFTKILMESKDKKKPVVQKILIISHTALGSRSFCHQVWTGWILLFTYFTSLASTGVPPAMT